MTTTPPTDSDKGESEDRSAAPACSSRPRAHCRFTLTAGVTHNTVTLFAECSSLRNGVIGVGQDQAWDVLALAEREEADEMTDLIGADPLSFHWGSLVAVTGR